MNRTEIITLAILPSNVAELASIADLSSPFKTAALAVAVMCNYEKDVQATLDMINYLRGPRPLLPYDVQFLRDRLGGKGHVPRSYIMGTSPDNDYTPSAPYQIAVSDNPYSYPQSDYATLYLKSSGADSPRPVSLRLKPSEGKWYLWEHTFLADIRMPKSANPWA